MTLRQRVAVNVPAGLVFAALLAFAPPAAHADSPSKQKLPQAPKQLPSVQSHGKSLDFLFDALKAAPDEDSARAVEARIWAIWMKTPSDTVALLMSRASIALENNESDVALKLLDAIIKLRPDYTEAWNRRATLYYKKNDYTRAMEDIEEVLRREPRHFGALAGLGVILEEIGDDKHALEVFRRALAINPHLDKVPDMVKSLTEKVEGRDI
ncbi:tetratricopeptide repeat protein [[Pseudomonas] carboxydohydrogena]|uniref:Tetratricopeptide repeat protein n=1 Tax=Afipia carboxydohydrogena TaxID=290 RepID=A0ABY8BQR3_AFICR|nr:tetratricopeptide repeat protein [[Pseudomonas] carboxydohydrogena]WEF52342.1 tetratricopeptide repeat protein [[Pseudomonas] carboxydohydrogena]